MSKVWLYPRELELLCLSCNRRIIKTNDAVFIWQVPYSRKSTAEQVASENVEKVIYAPIQGNVIPRESISDETFASGVGGASVLVEEDEDDYKQTGDKQQV